MKKKYRICNLEKIKKEVDNAKKIIQKYNWPVIDVTRKSVEETAASVIKIYEITKKMVNIILASKAKLENKFYIIMV